MKCEVFPTFHGCVPQSVPPLLGTEPCQLWSKPTWHRLVYFIRSLAQLPCSTHCTQCRLTESVRKCKKKKRKAQLELHQPTCPVPRVSRAAGAPHGPGLKPLLPSVVRSESPYKQRRQQWMKRVSAERGARSLRTRPHMHIHLLLFRCTRVPPSLPLHLSEEAFLCMNHRQSHVHQAVHATAPGPQTTWGPESLRFTSGQLVFGHCIFVFHICLIICINTIST